MDVQRNTDELDVLIEIRDLLRDSVRLQAAFVQVNLPEGPGVPSGTTERALRVQKKLLAKYTQYSDDE